MLQFSAHPEWQPHTYYADYRQAFPLSESMLGMTANNSANNAQDNVEDDNDHTDLASSNSLTSLTPVDDVLPNSSTHVERNGSTESPGELSIRPVCTYSPDNSPTHHDRFYSVAAHQE